MSKPEIILASSSPRRKELLSSVIPEFKTIAPQVDESSVQDSDPVGLVRKLSYLKASTIAQKHENALIIGCDTVVWIEGQILGKPKNKDEARQMLKLLSGKKHNVTTGVCVINKDKATQFEKTTQVSFYSLTDDEIERYIETDEPYDKAGGYGIQELGGLFVKKIKGDYYTVVGLPIAKLNRVLIKLKY